jgi:hypothetical protein
MRNPNSFTNQEVIDRIISKERNNSMINDVSMFGPQRFGPDAQSLEQTTDDRVWVDKDGNEFYGDDVTSYNPLEKVEGKKRRTELNQEEESWMHTHEHLIEKMPDDSEYEVCEYNEEVNDGEGPVISDVEFSKERTELTLQELKKRRRMCYDPQFAIDKLMEDWNGEEYLLNLLLLKQEVHKHICYASSKYMRFLWVIGMQQKRKEYSSGHWTTIWKSMPKEEGRFTSLDIEISDSYKYKGKKYVVVKCLIDGKHWVTVRHVEGYSWISSHKNMTPATLNELLAFAGV